MVTFMNELKVNNENMKRLRFLKHDRTKHITVSCDCSDLNVISTWMDEGRLECNTDIKYKIHVDYFELQQTYRMLRMDNGGNKSFYLHVLFANLVRLLLEPESLNNSNKCLCSNLSTSSTGNFHSFNLIAYK
jgi:hypothetical protein